MPLPFIIGVAGAAAGVAGAGVAIKGAVDMKDANDTMKIAKSIRKESINNFKKQNTKTTKMMDAVGNKELKILESFNDFADVFEKIKNRPEFIEYKKEGIQIPKLSKEEIKNVSIGATAILGALGGAALGTAGGFAAAGATTSAVMALGTASTGTAIASLSGAALTNATLAAIGGGAIAAGGGGIALGTTILGVATAGVGLLVGGVIFGITGSKLSEKADEAFSQAKKVEKEVNDILPYLKTLYYTARNFLRSLTKVECIYKDYLFKLKQIVETEGKSNWNEFSYEEKIITENTIYLVQLLYSMCKTQLVLQNSDKKSVNSVNKKEIEKAIDNASVVLNEIAENRTY